MNKTTNKVDSGRKIYVSIFYIKIWSCNYILNYKQIINTCNKNIFYYSKLKKVELIKILYKNLKITFYTCAELKNVTKLLCNAQCTLFKVKHIFELTMNYPTLLHNLPKSAFIKCFGMSKMISFRLNHTPITILVCG